jgi:hypothetical protein
MKKTISITAVALIAALAAPLRADVTPQDVHDSAHKAGHHIKKNTKQAGEKTEAGAKDAENAGNRGAYKLRGEKDEAKAKWDKDHSEEGGNAKTSGTESSEHHPTSTTPLRDLHRTDDASGDTATK